MLSCAVLNSKPRRDEPATKAGEFAKHSPLAPHAPYQTPKQGPTVETTQVLNSNLGGVVQRSIVHLCGGSYPMIS
jgi:hypothetical protein